ncbi:MAG: hypothetical protein PHQ96_01535 [Candidatus Omnitrophica bacterium]|nr:hypothetical protein [Candidatus Omnitrophota bacterium]
MRGFCGIDIEGDKIFISFASLDKQVLNFLEEIEIPVPLKGREFIDCLSQNAQIISGRISEKEIAYSLRVEKIFLNLPWKFVNTVLVEETIPFKSRKKLSYKDINLAKNYLEDTAIDWDDLRLHHFVLSYEIEGTHFSRPPVGSWAKKIKLRSKVFSVKEKLNKDVEDIFDNLDREFGGFVFSGISAVSSFLAQPQVEHAAIVISIGFEESFASVYTGGNIEFINGLGFSITSILQEIEKNFLLPFDLAKDIIQRYLSFRDTPHFKEISAKNAQGYINVSTQTLNSYVKEYVKKEMLRALEEIKNQLKLNSCTVSIIGRLNAYEGFSDFLKGFLGEQLEPFVRGGANSSSFGCLRYGISRFLEVDCAAATSVLQKMMAIYREYF